MKSLRVLFYLFLATLAASQAQARESTEIKCTQFVEKSGDRAPQELVIIVPPIGDASAFVTMIKDGAATVSTTNIDSVMIAKDRSKIEVAFDTANSMISLMPAKRQGKKRIPIYKGELQLFETQKFTATCRVHF